MKKLNCILLIDDDIDDNEFHKIIITQTGVCNHIRTAEDGIKALEYIQKSANPELQDNYPKPDLIFLDINMPRMNGFEFLEAYQQLDEELRAAIVICMLTTSLNPKDKKRALEIPGIINFKPKPLTAQMLTEIVKEYFNDDTQ